MCRGCASKYPMLGEAVSCEDPALISDRVLSMLSFFKPHLHVDAAAI